MGDRAIAYLYGGDNETPGTRPGTLIASEWRTDPDYGAPGCTIDDPTVVTWYEFPFLWMPVTDEETHWFGVFHAGALVKALHIAWMIPGGSIIRETTRIIMGKRPFGHPSDEPVFGEEWTVD